MAHLDLRPRNEEVVWIYVLLGLLGAVVWVVLWKATQALDAAVQRHLHRRREVKFLRFVRVILPTGKVVEAITIADTEEQALRNIERRLRDASKSL